VNTNTLPLHHDPSSLDSPGPNSIHVTGKKLKIKETVLLPSDALMALWMLDSVASWSESDDRTGKAMAELQGCVSKVHNNSLKQK
jgi:hypothetical protein